MKGTVAIGIVALFAFAASPVLANEKTAPQRHDQEVTGCLASGDSAGQYKLMGQDGTTWKVKEGEYVNLASYVGHTVTLSGPGTESKRHGDSLTALDVAVDSQSCQQ